MLKMGTKGATGLKTLTDREIRENYAFTAGRAIAEGESLTCANCGSRYAAPGTPCNLFTRIAGKASPFPTSVELCEFCVKRVFPRLT